MKKHVLFTLSLLLTATIAMAIPAKRGLWKTLRLADGTEVRAELVGDEYGHCYRAADGRCFVIDYSQEAKTGDKVYKLADLKALQASADSARLAARQEMIKRAPAKARVGESNGPYLGEKKGLIILTQFSDKKFADGHDQALYNRIANEENFKEGNFVGSVRDYYKAQSGGQFTISFDVVGPITLPKSYTYYGRDYGSYKDVNVAEMVREALRAANEEVNYKDYDWDGDGNVEQVFFLYAGEGQATGGDDNTIWPHMSSITKLMLDDVYLTTYACSNELIRGNIAGIGAVCHEFSHCMGLPDMYDTSYGGNFGMADWDVMDQGSYNGGTFIPANYTAYERMFCGWMQPQELADGMEVSGMKSLTDNGQTYVMHNTGNSNEYYLFENRQLRGWDAGLPGSGMLVTHVDYDKSIWASNNVNTTSTGRNDHERCTILPANGTKGSSGTANQLYPTSTNNNITKGSTPNMSLYNTNAEGENVMELALINITQANDGTISFNVKDNDKIGTENRPENAIFYESFDLCNGAGGNDGVFSGTNIGNGSFTPDNSGWTVTGGKGGGSQCARFGTNTQRGYAKTPSVTIDGSVEYVLVFKAAPFNGDGTTLALSSTNSAVTLSEKSVTMKAGQWTQYSVNISGTGATTFGLRSNKGRFFLDEVAVIPASQSGITDVTTAADYKSGRIYTVDGRYVGTSLETLPKGVYIVGGKKIAK